jgi:hypothetical protein
VLGMGWVFASLAPLIPWCIGDVYVADAVNNRVMIWGVAITTPLTGGSTFIAGSASVTGNLTLTAK